MGKKTEFLRNTGILFLGKVFTQFLSFLLLPLYTAFLSTDEYGSVDLIMTYVMLVMPLVSLQIERAAFRYLIEVRGDREKSSIIISAITKIVICSIVVFSAGYLLLWQIMKFEYALLVYCYCVLHLITSVLQQIARGHGKNVVYAIASCILGAGTIVGNIFFVAVLREGLRGMLLSLVIAYSVMAIYLVASLRSRSSKTEKNSCRAARKKMLNYSIPLIPDSISWWVLNVSDRTLLALFIGSAANGLYAVANKFSSVFVGGFNIVNMAWQESVSLYIGKDDKFIKEMTCRMIYLFASMCAVAICVIPMFFSIMIGGDYYESFWHIPLLMLGAFFTVGLGLFQSIYIGMKQTKKVAKTSMLCAGINIVINLLLIKNIGIYAASLSTLISYMALFMYRYIDLRKEYKLRLDRRATIVSMLVMLLSCVVYYNSSSVPYLSIFGTIITFALMMAMNMNSIKKILVMIKRRRKT